MLVLYSPSCVLPRTALVLQWQGSSINERQAGWLAGRAQGFHYLMYKEELSGADALV